MDSKSDHLSEAIRNWGGNFEEINIFSKPMDIPIRKIKSDAV